MRHILLILSFLLVTFVACNNNKTTTYSLKDSVIQKHFNVIDSLGQFDTTDINYKVLKAYIANDTSFFKQLSTDIENDKKFNQQWGSLDSCIHQPKLQELHTDEAYRFIYNTSFCPYKVNITISKKGDNSNLHFILYQFKWDTASCRIISEYDKKLTAKNWEDFKETIRRADFWGLKKENGIHGVDGDDIIVIGYEKGDTAFNRSAKFNYVNRWLLAQTTLGEPFNLVLKLSGNKQGCFWAE